MEGSFMDKTRDRDLAHLLLELHLTLHCLADVRVVVGVVEDKSMEFLQFFPS